MQSGVKTLTYLFSLSIYWVWQPFVAINCAGTWRD
jgi:hypothetical protein